MTYKNGNYFVTILSDGTKIRRTMADEFIPEFSENCDVKITDKCSQGCPFCYEGCSKSGQHGNLLGYTKFLESLHPGTELALNGNDLDHPDLSKFLEILKSKRVFANITVNQNQFLKNFEKIREYQKAKMIYGVGVSLQDPNQTLIQKLKETPNSVLHTIIGILSKRDIDILKQNDLKILLLGYKRTGRGIQYELNNENTIRENTKYLKDHLESLLQEFKVVSFDNLAIEQLDPKRFLSDSEWSEFYMGDDGGYTFYIDLVKGEFSKNSVTQSRFPIGDLGVDEMFNFIRAKYENSDKKGSLRN